MSASRKKKNACNKFGNPLKIRFVNVMHRNVKIKFRFCSKSIRNEMFQTSGALGYLYNKLINIIVNFFKQYIESFFLSFTATFSVKCI